MNELVAGGNVPLPDGAVTLRVPGPFDLSVIVTGDSGKVAGDEDFVFYNQPATSGARIQGDTVTVDGRRLRAGASRVTVAVSPAEPGTPLGRLPGIALQVHGPGGRLVARFTPPRPDRETVLLLAEIYRRGPGWKLRALGQGYADGLAGVARDFGVDVAEDEAPQSAAASRARPSTPSGAGPSGASGAGPGAASGAGSGGSSGAGPGAASGAGPSGTSGARPGAASGAGPSGPSGAGPGAASGAGPSGPSGAGPGAASGAGAGGASGARSGAPSGERLSAPPGRPLIPSGRSAPAGPAVSSGPAGPDGFLPLVNAARASVGAPPVALDARLSAAAHAHAAGMAARSTLSSEHAGGTSLYQRVVAGGYAYLAIGEHLVSGPRTAAEFVEYCLSGEQSRRTVHGRAYTQVGVAHTAAARSGDLYWTAVWASPFTAQGLAEWASAVLRLTNAERTAAGLRPLSPDPLLTVAAQNHSADMIARAFYAHTSPDGGEPWHRASAAGSGHRAIGENIACGQRTPAEVVDGWMDSPGHRANILKPSFTHLGVGYAGGGSAGTYWTQLFGG
ncbi:CAP domain-containing protein [Streptomyces sp. NPDC051218]|uniref:CAP domain-containing protein n=1 Tax=Streptomyces sp. NPDC051218 TaxID=3365645 RepID=UPI00379B8DA9